MSKVRYVVMLGACLLAAPELTTAQQSQARVYGTARGAGYRLSGIYVLDRARSEDVRTVVNRAVQSTNAVRRDRLYQNWVNRLDAPDTIAVDIVGRRVTLASSNAAQFSFDADGSIRTDTMPTGRTVSSRAQLLRNRLVVTTTGNRGNDFTVTMEPVANGMRVTRRLDSEYPPSVVSVQSFYRWVGEPSWTVYTPTYTPAPRAYLPVGTQLTAKLDRALNPRTVREGERFTMTVTAPSEFNGATIDGYVVKAPKEGAPNMVLNFDRVWLPAGRSVTFTGEIQAVRLPGGASVQVDRSGVVRDRGRSTSETVQSGAFGAAFGAIIGAIAGGKKGALIGALAGGAGMILLNDGSSNPNLPAGTELTISTLSSGN